MKLIGYLIKEKMEGRKQNGEKAKWRNFEAKWRKNCCAIKIQKKLNVEISLKGVVGVNKARVKENCFFIIESWEKKYYEKNMTL